MATEGNVFATLACCLLASSFAIAQTNMAATTSTPGSNTTTFVTSANTTANVTENTTPFAGTWKNNTAITGVTGHTQTSESTSNTTQTTPPGSNSTLSTPAAQNTTGYTSAPDTTLTTTTNTTSESEPEMTPAVGLKVSEESMTIVFSVMLGLFGFGFIVFMFNKCRHKFQYLHQPLNNSSDTDVLVADDDTLVISGGLYDGNPNYDNAPTAPADESQFRLEFLH